MLSAVAAPLNKRKTCYNKATLTQYWIPKQGDPDQLNNGKNVTLNGAKTMALRTVGGRVIAEVSKLTYKKFQMEGTGLLEDGTMVNLDEGQNTFMTVNRQEYPYGVGSNGNALVPWVSVASNDLPHKSTLYVKHLDGVKLPNGQVHNGCVRVDDKGWSFGDCQLDFFVLQYTAYERLDSIVPETVDVEQKQCTVKNYVDATVKTWAGLH
ncbi:hypothetical protein DM01DRAFT_260588 [Hesseltinella vesiculosa]|uniref:3D domain-containing protein n=1 Tax=Hesseltinella vesiculosa TaxID=101127 RepID=A0A1X2GUJ4_9FUNG|nr:hypothetical protein DM01DRAFT_260588 [Hesseltinella vesiculosa]